MRVLVTGGTSLLGRHVVERLAADGHAVTVMQRGPSGLDREFDGVREVRGSIESPDDVRRAIEDQSGVIHLAAKVDVVGPWEEYERINVGGTRTIVDAARSSGVQRFVHVSTPSVAHGGESIAGEGAAPADPTSTRGHYATSKALAELATLDASSGQMPIVALRPHLVWGPGDTQLVGRIVERARSGRLVVIGGGGSLVDTTYVTNAADAIVAALGRADAVAGRAFVISNGEPRTVHELLRRLSRAAGAEPARLPSVPRPVALLAGSLVDRLWPQLDRGGEPPITRFLAEQLSTAHWFDQRAAREALGWVPTVRLDEGFDRLAEFYATP